MDLYPLYFSPSYLGEKDTVKTVLIGRWQQIVGDILYFINGESIQLCDWVWLLCWDGTFRYLNRKGYNSVSA